MADALRSTARGAGTWRISDAPAPSDDSSPVRGAARNPHGRRGRDPPTTGCRAAGSVARHRDALPQPGERVAVVGCGTSLYMARCYGALREGADAG